MSPNRPGGASGRASLPVMAHHSGQAAPLSIVSAGGDALRQQMQTATSSLPIIVPSVSRQLMSPGTRSWLLCPVCGDAIIGPSGLQCGLCGELIHPHCGERGTGLGTGIVCVVCIEDYQWNLHRQQVVQAGDMAAYVGRTTAQGASMSGLAIGTGIASLARGGQSFVTGALAGARAAFRARNPQAEIVQEVHTMRQDTRPSFLPTQSAAASQSSGLSTEQDLLRQEMAALLIRNRELEDQLVSVRNSTGGYITPTGESSEISPQRVSQAREAATAMLDGQQAVTPRNTRNVVPTEATSDTMTSFVLADEVAPSADVLSPSTFVPPPGLADGQVGQRTGAGGDAQHEGIVAATGVRGPSATLDGTLFPQTGTPLALAPSVPSMPMTSMGDAFPGGVVSTQSGVLGWGHSLGFAPMATVLEEPQQRAATTTTTTTTTTTIISHI